jgi:FixJ family two-component response regulator
MQVTVKEFILLLVVTEKRPLDPLACDLERTLCAAPPEAGGTGMHELPLIAIVDDDTWMRRSTARLLKSASFRAESFVSAEDYLAAGDHEETGCIILDISLPGMSGLELERRLTADRNRRPIVFVSARNEPEVRDEATLAGAVAFLGKPFDDHSLLEAVASALVNND